MPRSARVVVPNLPHHVIQRGHNRSVVFADDADFLLYLDNLRRLKEDFKCRVYAYCLMPNHVHLVIDPGEEAGSLGLLMKRLAGRYTRFVNRVEDRTGTVWEGRYRSSPIDTDSYLLACCRYVELNPVRARMVRSPRQYRWSSYNEKAGHRRRDWIDEDPCYRGMGRTRAEREASYRAWISASVPRGEWDVLRCAVQRGQLTGDRSFVDMIQQKLGRRIDPRGPRRPRKSARVKPHKNRATDENRSVPILGRRG